MVPNVSCSQLGELLNHAPISTLQLQALGHGEGPGALPTTPHQQSPSQLLHWKAFGRGATGPNPSPQAGKVDSTRTQLYTPQGGRRRALLW
jgi:hypothetical protein